MLRVSSFVFVSNLLGVRCDEVFDTGDVVFGFRDPHSRERDLDTGDVVIGFKDPHGREQDLDDFMKEFVGSMGGPAQDDSAIFGPGMGFVSSHEPAFVLGRPVPHFHRRERDLDQMMDMMMTSMIPPAGALRGRHGQSVMTFGGPLGGGQIVIQSSGDNDVGLPPHVLQSLFPHPFVDDDGPDPMILNMMGDLNEQFASQIIPAIHQTMKTALKEAQKPGPCNSEAERFCKSQESRLHCLGNHANDLSDGCRSNVGQSVPFLCHDEIDAFCDLMQTSILSCLGDRLAELHGDCRDAVAATRHAAVKSQEPNAAQKTLALAQHPEQHQLEVRAKQTAAFMEQALEGYLKELKRLGTPVASIPTGMGWMVLLLLLVVMLGVTYMMAPDSWFSREVKAWLKQSKAEGDYLLRSDAGLQLAASAGEQGPAK